MSHPLTRPTRAIASVIAPTLVLLAGTASAAPPRFIDLHTSFPTAQGETNVRAVTPDGRFAVGTVVFSTALTHRAVIWDLATGAGTLLPDPAGIIPGTADAFGISDDGTVVFGSAAMTGVRVTVRWVNGVPSVVNGSGWLDNFGVSGDGVVAVGRTFDPSSGLWLATRWTPSDGALAMQPLAPGESPSSAFDTTFDGATTVGVSRGVIGDPIFGGFIENFATEWDAFGNPQRLEVLNVLGTWANKITPDGRYAVGNAATGTGLRAAVRWDRQMGEAMFLTRAFTNDFTFGNPSATAISPDGAVVAANVHEFGFESPTALWSEDTGLVPLKNLLVEEFGLDLAGWSLSVVSDMTLLPDGSILVVGNGNFESVPGDPFTRERHAFMAVVPGLVGQAETACDPLWEAPPSLSSPGLTDFVGSSDPVQVNDLVPFGDSLYALGIFVRAGGANIGSSVARWNGSQWSPVGVGLGGTGASARVGQVFDDGSGEALYVGGFFSIAGGQFIDNLARWDGSQWSPVGNANLNGGVASMIVHDDGSGPALFIGGAFTSAAGIEVRGLARWNGNQWSSVGSPLGGTLDVGPRSMAVYDDGSGPALYISGPFQSVGGVPAAGIAKWDGSQWSPVGTGLVGWSEFMAAYDDGSGPALYMIGTFDAGGGSLQSGLIRWNGQSYELVAAEAGNVVKDMGVFDFGNGPVLTISASGGTFTRGTEPTPRFNVASGLLAWDGQKLSRIGLPNEGYAGFFFAGELAEFDDGSGPAVYVGGDFDVVYSTAAPGGLASAGNIARIIPCQGGSQPCPADTNGDGVLSPADFSAWIAAFNAQAPACDQNGDNACTPADFSAWIANFNAGC